MPESFYGGKSGRSFEITTIFKNKMELDADIDKRFNSETPMNSFVAISYGRKNTEEYEINKKIDQDKYGEQFDSTLWYKVYSEVKITDPFSSLDRYGVKYVLIYDLAGQTPTIDFTDTESLNPADDPFIDISDISDSNYPILQAHLPRAVNWYTGLGLSEREDNLELLDNLIIYYIGDLYLNQYNGNLYKCITKTENGISYWNYVGNILGPTLEVNDVITSTLGSLENANVVINQERDENNVLIPLVDFFFSIPRGSRFYTGKGFYSSLEGEENKLLSIPQQQDINIEVELGDYFLESETEWKIGFIYQYMETIRENSSPIREWKFITSIFGKTPLLEAESKPVNPDKQLIVEVVYDERDTGYNFPLLKFEIPRGSKWFTQENEPIVGTDSPQKAGSGDFWFNLTDGYIYQYTNNEWINVGTFIIDLSNTETFGKDPYIISLEGKATPSIPEFSIIIDENNPASRPKVEVKLPNAPIVTVNKTVEILAPDKKGEVSLNYSTKGYELNFKLPQGIQGEIGKGLNIRRSYDSIADRDLNAEGLIWRDADACTVRTQEGSSYFDVYVYQNDYPDKWVYTGTLLISSINDNLVSIDHSWSSNKVNNELQNLETKLQEDIKEATDGLSDLINQNISQEIIDINTRIDSLEENSASKDDLQDLQQTVVNVLSVGIQENAEMITKIVRELAKPWTWGDLKNGKRLSISRSMLDKLNEEDKLLFMEEENNELS